MTRPDTYRQFVFERYEFDRTTKLLQLYYNLDGLINLCETYTFDFEFGDYSDAVLDRAIQNLFFMAGVSYYKTYIPREIVVKTGSLDAEQAAFFSKTYQRGLGEFWYVNKLDPSTAVNFPSTVADADQIARNHIGQGLLIGLGGGKDSLVTIDLLRTAGTPMTTWALGHQKQLQPLVDAIGLPHLRIQRTWDTKLLEINASDGLNGHVPISAIFATAGIVAAVLSGRRDVVVSNEHAANEATLTYQDIDINHQYSKSQEFEADFQALLRHDFGDSLRYYSFLRPLSELRIAELFAQYSFDTYKHVFSSCNRAFTHDSSGLYWCGKCPKCAFVFLIFTPFVGRPQLEALWNGKNLLLDPSLKSTYRQLLGIDAEKPLECVGEIRESRTAMRLAQEIYPELRDLYEFDIPDEYDYRSLHSDEMPTEISEILRRSFTE